MTVDLDGSSKQLCLALPAKDLTILGKPFKACFVQIDKGKHQEKVRQGHTKDKG